MIYNRTVRWMLLVALAAGCKFSGSTGTPSDGSDSELMIDAAIDAPPDAFDPLCFAGGTFYFCFPQMPSGDVTVPTSIDTMACTGTGLQILTIGTTSVCVLAGNTVTLDTDTFVTGTRPLVLVAVTSMTISASLDVASSLGNLGPGANATECNTAATMDGAMSLNGGGGGAGGTFGTIGGAGGTGAGGATAGGAALPVPAKSAVLHGGCPGGKGLPGPAAGLPSPGGPGGGAVMLVSRGTLTVSGTIDAAGGGAAGGTSGKGGGGGGGSGGMIVFHAGTLTITGSANINANGGGGGGGGGANDAGDPGGDPDAAMPTKVALGGQAQDKGRCRGGNGAAAATAATPGANGANGGGGGGGGVGLIRVLAPSNPTFPANTTSPTPVN